MASGTRVAALSVVDLRCKVLRAANPLELEAEVNRFLAEIDLESEAQLEEISQSEGPHGITITIWYTLLDEQNGALIESDEELEEQLLSQREEPS